MRSLILILFIFHTANICSAQRGEKMSPALQQYRRPADITQEKIFWLSAQHIDSIKNYLRQKQLPVKILSEFPHTGLLVIQTSWRVIDSTLIFSPLVRFVDIPRKPKEEQALNVFDNSLNKINLLHHRLPALKGDSLVVSVKEKRFNTNDIDFSGRYIVTPFESSEFSPHATIMATIVAGAGNSFYTGRGAAWGAGISSSDFASLLPDTAYRRFNISVQNHSYGTGIENYYGADAAAYDATVITDPWLLHVFSAGNDGNQTSTAGAYTGISGLANLTGSFKMAKNIITVGAVDSFGIVSPLSSKGPAYDGRIKPGLVAFGQDGSSGAAATVSGISLLVQKAFNGGRPNASLVKAVLINTADDLNTEGPDYHSGYGNVNAYKAVNTILQNRYAEGSITNGSTQQVEITVPPATRKLSVTLCWSDPPATANAPRALINDLDLALENWQPWVLSSFPHKDSLLLPARRGRDSLNNVEKISVIDPAPGNYTISVHGYEISLAPQNWSLTWQIDTAGQFEWTYPTSSDGLIANEKNIIRWSNTFDDAATGKLEYSIDKGNSWSLLENAVALKNEYYNLITPNIFSLILFRMTINGQVFISDTSSISKPLNVQVGFNCPDSVMLYWNSTSLNNYTVWKLGEKYMEPIANTTDSFFIFQKTVQPNYTVSPIFGIKAHTIDYTLQGVQCYAKNFLVDLAGSNSALLTFEASSLYNVKEIVFEKLNGNSFISLTTIPANGNLSFNFTDNNLRKGSNLYRAVIVLANGQKINSHIATVMYFGNSPYLIFPNPASRNAPLQIHSPDLQPRQLVIFNSSGQQVKQQTLSNLISNISLSHLQKGVYFIMILKEGKKDYSGHLIVQ